MLHQFAATGAAQYFSDIKPFIPDYQGLRKSLRARKRGLGRGRARHDLIAQLVRQINQHPHLRDEQKAKLIILTLIRQSQEAERDRSSAAWSRIKQFALADQKDIYFFFQHDIQLFMAQNGHDERAVFLTEINKKSFFSGGEDDLSQDERNYLTSTKPHALFAQPDLLDKLNAHKHLNAYLKLMSPESSLNRGEKKNVMYSIAYLSSFLQLEEPLVEEPLAALTSDQQADIQHLYDIHFGPEIGGERPIPPDFSAISVQKRMPSIDVRHPLENGFCMGLALAFSGVFYESPNLDYAGVRQTYNATFHDVPIGIQAEGLLMPVHAWVARLQYRFGSHESPKVEGTSMTSGLSGTKDAVFLLTLKSNTGRGHALLFGRRGDSFFIWDSNRKEKELASFCFGKAEDFDAKLAQYLAEHYSTFQHKFVEKIDVGGAMLRDIQAEKHAPLKGRAPPKLARARPRGPDLDLAPGSERGSGA